MSNNQYNNKKLAPFKRQRDTLKEELKKLQQEQADEEKLNDNYFDEIGRVEKEYESLIKQIELYNKHNHTLKAIGQMDQNQGLDETIEKNVIQTLNLFLLNTSKKEYLESIQEQEISKKQLQSGNLIMTQIQPNDEKQIIQEVENTILEDGYYVSLKQGCNSLVVKIPGTVRTFKELKQIVKSCFMAEEKEIFYTDLMGNVIQPDMIILDQLYPSIYELLKNYQPVIGIKIIKQKKIREDTKKTEADFMFDGATQELMTKQLRSTKRIQKSINWSKYMDYMTNLKYILESILFVSLLILYAIIEISELDFFTNSQLLLNQSLNMAIQKSYISPITNISQIISLSIPNGSAHGLSPTYPLQSGLLIQTLVGIDNFNNCNILNENQKQMYLDNNQSCLMFDITQTSQLNQSYTKLNFDPKVYNEQFGGYVWEFNLSSRESFQESYNQMISEEWLQYNIKQSQFLLNYYNGPTQRIIQVCITTLYLFNDRLMNYNSFQAEGFNLKEIPEQVLINKDIIFYCSIVLLISSFFDFFGLYLIGTKNNLIVIYLQYQELLNRKKKLEAKKRQITESDQKDLQQKELIVGEYAIINLKVIYVTIRIPLVFDYICNEIISILDILCQFGMVMKNTIDDQYEEALQEIDLKSAQYQDASALIIPLFLSRIFSAVLVLFLMISIVRFMGNWSPYLKCYGLVMIRFNSQSWFLMLVLIFIISVCAMSWIVTIQGKLINHDNFIYTFLGLLRCTLRFGLDNDIEQQGFYNTYAKDKIYSFETKYLQYIIIITITMIMIPIFISLMTDLVQNTKVEAKQKMMEMRRQNQK
ncbi:unnamed protein product (macronuclear) [Paramecium tetraurelia]|uniref:Transmembrane protein n=1 Tax=Paramecium tetraurelia TaxID=5888 RepID=A0BMX0_PARTE|nr:uncharacterized protein GSPATT00030524001 [Paramecium tetraurelia]CAK59887.1 unnamed protein product [Paramecium tetraurelia]|eukprot:XP_001427285.1 hypothetical protein (macronuclear) [Paramecium tetraurelia strain d4-2]